ncbi:MAG: hypothetical protein Fur0027_14470 [Raineya sp.]
MAKNQKSLERLFSAINKAQNKDDLSKQPVLPKADFSILNLSKPQKAIFASKEAINLFLAGQGAGKTFLAGIITAYLIQAYPHKKGLIAANTYSQLSGSTLFRIREVWKECFGWKEYNEYTKQGHYTVGVQPPSVFNTTSHNFENYRNIISFCNGTVIHYHTLDNYKPIDGLEISWACLDETKDTRPEAITEVILGRLRQKTPSEGSERVRSGSEFSSENSERARSSSEFDSENSEQTRKEHSELNQLFIFTSPAKSSFLNEFFNLYDYETEIQTCIYSDTDFFARKTASNKFVVISSALHNKSNLPENFIERQKSVLPLHLQDMLIYGNPFAKSGGEFYKGFDRTKHVDKCSYDSSLPLHITFDFNVQPYITLCVWQIAGKHARQIDEICLTSPRNNTYALCREFKRKYQGHTAGLFIYGDPSGKHADTRNQKGYNDFTIIASELKDFKPSLRIAPKAPAVVMRGNFINAILEQNFADISILIDEKCKNTLADYLYLKESADGTKHKEKTQENGVSFEKYGHCSDANDYFLCEAFKNEFNRYLRGGQESKPLFFGLFKRNENR